MSAESEQRSPEWRSTEESLLLECGRRAVRPEHDGLEPPAGVDWETFEQLAESHKMVPFVDEVLSSIEPAGVPESVRTAFDERHREHVRRNLHLVSVLCEARAVLSDDGIRTLPFKGPSLAAAVHGSVTARQSVDVDLLVAPEDIDAAVAALDGAGFAMDADRIPPVEAAHRRVRNHCTLRHESGIGVELHWALTPATFPYPYDFDRLWENREAVELQDETVPAPSTTDRALLLVVHGGKHGWEALGWLVDVAVLLTRHDVEWSEVLTRARERGCERLLLLAGVLASNLLRVDVPEPLVEPIAADSSVEALGEPVRRNFLWRWNDSALRQLKYRLQSRERWKDRVHAAGGLLFRPHPTDVDRLPRALQYRPVAGVVRQVRAARTAVEELLLGSS